MDCIATTINTLGKRYLIHLQNNNNWWSAFYEDRSLARGTDKTQVLMDATVELERVLALARPLSRGVRVIANKYPAILLRSLEVGVEDDAIVSYDDCPNIVTSVPWNKIVLETT